MKLKTSKIHFYMLFVNNLKSEEEINEKKFKILIFLFSVSLKQNNNNRKIKPVNEEKMNLDLD